MSFSWQFLLPFLCTWWDMQALRFDFWPTLLILKPCGSAMSQGQRGNSTVEHFERNANPFWEDPKSTFTVCKTVLHHDLPGCQKTGCSFLARAKQAFCRHTQKRGAVLLESTGLLALSTTTQFQEDSWERLFSLTSTEGGLVEHRPSLSADTLPVLIWNSLTF